jgi:hypothetical protein
LFGRCVSALAATLLIDFGVLGLLSSLLAILATDFDVDSLFLGIDTPPLPRTFQEE